jgi:hypothetical protein
VGVRWTWLVPTTQVLRTVGDYQLERRVGRGAMGEVWLGRHVQSGSPAAIKLLRPRDGERSAHDRFQRFFARERRAIARLSHPNIVPLFEVGADFYVTAYVHGSDLARHLQGVIDPAAAVAITLEIASALEHAHARGVVHRDVKPSNILLDAVGTAYLADFGLAEILEEGDSLSDRVGTPQFMAPEQTRGEGVGPAADQYALARTLLEMLAGGRVSTDPARALDQLSPSLPAAMRTFLRRATEADPARRWPSMTAFRTELARIDLSACSAPARLLPEVRVRAPFGWASSSERVVEVAHEIQRADYRLSTLEQAGVLDRERCAEFRRRSGYADFGWSVLGRSNRLGPVTESTAYSRALEVVVLLHGTLCDREAWMGLAPLICRDHAQSLVLVPDINGHGASAFEADVGADRLGPRSLLHAVLAWLDLLGVRELPSVLVGHSFAATALLTVRDDELGPRTSRIAITPVFPDQDRWLRWAIHLTMPLFATLGDSPRSKDVVGRILFSPAGPAGMYDRTERERMLRHFRSVPMRALTTGMLALARARPAQGDPFQRCAVVLAERDPIARLAVSLAALERLGVPAIRIHRLHGADGHMPHVLVEKRPERSQRFIAEVAALVDQLIVSCRDGTLLPTRVASTVFSTGAGGSSAD